MGLPRKPPVAQHLSDKEWRRRSAEAIFEVELMLREEGAGDAAFVYDEVHELFRFRDGKFAFFRERADWRLLRERGRMDEEL